MNNKSSLLTLKNENKLGPNLQNIVRQSKNCRKIIATLSYLCRKSTSYDVIRLS